MMYKEREGGGEVDMKKDIEKGKSKEIQNLKTNFNFYSNSNKLKEGKLKLKFRFFF